MSKTCEVLVLILALASENFSSERRNSLVKIGLYQVVKEKLRCQLKCHEVRVCKMDNTIKKSLWSSVKPGLHTPVVVMIAEYTYDDAPKRILKL